LQLGGSRLWETDVRLARVRFLDALGRHSEADAELERAAAAARRQETAGPARLVETVHVERQRGSF
jgi:hypothetical protein